ncbi:MAG: selenium-binding protein, partial [Steroidobacteraceae bacterium]
WNDGMARLFDISVPHAPVQVMEQKIGAQLNMVSQSWDGERVYFTSSLLANWDKVEAPEGEDLQFFKAYAFKDGKLSHEFTVDFLKAKLGTPHQMRFGAYALYGK